MSEPPTAESVDDRRAARELDRARESVRAMVERWTGDPRPPQVRTAAPLGSPPDAVRARVSARVAAGLSPTGTDSPTADLPRRVVLPCGVLAVADALAVIVMALTGHLVLTVIAAVLFVPLAGIALSAARYTARDPLRLSADDRAALAATCRWASSQPWEKDLAESKERGLLEAVVRAAERAASSAAWQSTSLDSAGVRINLAAELDRVDAAAFALARARARSDGAEQMPGGEASGQSWTALLDRAALLSCYAERLAAAENGPLDTAQLAALVAGQQG